MNKDLIEITMKEIRYIMGDNFSFFNVALNNTYCSKCPPPHESSIYDYKAYLNNLGEIELDGHCKTCNSKVGRYIESSGNPDEIKRAKEIINMQSRNDESHSAFEGFTPNQMDNIFYHPFTKKCPIQLNTDINPEMLIDNSPIYKLLIIFLQKIKEENEIKLTSTGRLPAKYIKEFYAYKLLPDDLIEIGI